MTKKRRTRRALINSVISLLICFSMLLGTTFAWFTDSVESVNNKIIAGNLDVELYHSNNSGATNVKVTETTDDLFHIDRWEPGAVVYENFTVANEGSLALRYELSMNTGSYNTLNGHNLSEVIKAVVLDEKFTGDRDDAIAAFTASSEEKSLKDLLNDGELYPKSNDEGKASEKTFAVILYWEPKSNEKDNLYNANNGQKTSDGKELFIELGINLFATQLSYESDSFDPTYDINAATAVTTVEELNAAIAAGNAALLEGVAADTFDNVTLDITKDATIIVQKDEIGGTLNIAEGATVSLYGGEALPLTVTGAGTLELNGITITATEDGESAVTVGVTEATTSLMTAEETTTNVVVNGATVLTGAKNGSGIYVEEGYALNLSGNGSLTAIGNAGKEYLEGYDVYCNTDDDSYDCTGTACVGGHGIGGEGTIVIDGLKKLTAEGYGEAGFGIGGNVERISISDTYIPYVRGGFANDDSVDPNHAKKDAEGGAAIGSMYDGASIVLDGVTIDKAEGGSKAAGIGARYWNAVTVEIRDSKIYEVIGGVSAAAIGGSRVRSENSKTQTTEITIIDSEINAQGGYYAAGIGSGYNTNCAWAQNAPECTINIKGNSVITAKGGYYGAGIGTGYHNGLLLGEIEDTVEVTAEAGEGARDDKDYYTKSMGVGFGILDTTREGAKEDLTTGPKKNYSEFVYNGETITIDDAVTWGEASSDEETEEGVAVNADNPVETVVANTTYVIEKGTYTTLESLGLETIDVDGVVIKASEGDTVKFTAAQAMVVNEGQNSLTLENLEFTNGLALRVGATNVNTGVTTLATGKTIAVTNCKIGAFDGITTNAWDAVELAQIATEVRVGLGLYIGSFGNHKVVVSGCTFDGKGDTLGKEQSSGYSLAFNAIDASPARSKTESITVENCTFVNTGKRCIQLTNLICPATVKGCNFDRQAGEGETAKAIIQGNVGNHSTTTDTAGNAALTLENNTYTSGTDRDMSFTKFLDWTESSDGYLKSRLTIK